jgi:hypothetical protein
MTPKQGREQIYNYILDKIDKDIEFAKIHSPLKKLLKRYAKTEVAQILLELKTKLSGSIEKGKSNPAFAAQIVALESILKWTDKKLYYFNKDASAQAN